MSDLPLPIADLTDVDEAPGDNRYFLVFSSRQITPTVSISPGHAFVSWGEWDNGAAACTYESYGLYNAGTIPGALGSFLFGPVPGEVQDEALNGFQSVGSTIDSLVVEVNIGQYMLSHHIMSQMTQEPQPYILGSNDCVTFVQNIAQVIGLNPPARGLFSTMPVPYIKALKQTAMQVQDSANFVGPMVGDFPAGFGKYTYPDGSTWVGNMHGLSMNGPGVYTMPNGTVIHATFSPDGIPDGICQYNFPDGSSFSGELVKGVPNGTGSYKYPDGSGYTGDLLNGKANGNGTCTFADGSSYTGAMVNGTANGKGTYKFHDGSSYTGDMQNGRATGVGKFIWSDGCYYQGSLVNGIQQGSGFENFPDGSYYGGFFKNGIANGTGMYYVAPHGPTIQGTWVNGALQGQANPAQVPPGNPLPPIDVNAPQTPGSIGFTITPGD